MAELSVNNVCIGRVLHEDDDFMTLEVIKNEDRSLRLEDGDRFYSLFFVRKNDAGDTEVWKPWDGR